MVVCHYASAMSFSREKYFIVGTFSLTPVLEGAELAASKRLYY